MSLYLGENLISGSKPINLGVRNIGEIVASSLPLTDAGLHLLDGSLILGGGIYQGFVDYIADLYDSSTKTSNVIKVGSLTDNNGVLSGFSTSNYATLPQSVSLGSNFEILFKVTTSNDVMSNNNLLNRLDASSPSGIAIAVNGGVLKTYISSNGSSWDIASGVTSTLTFNTNTTYYIRVIYNGSNYVYDVSTDKTNWTNYITISSASSPSSVTPVIGIYLGSGGTPWLGSIDLKESYININGQRWWTGANPSFMTDEPQWQTAVTTYGVCGKFVYDSVNNTVRLPKVTGIIEGTTDITALGDLVEAGLPNITGTFGSKGFTDGDFTATGAFKTVSMSKQTSQSYNSTQGQQFGIDASLSSLIYGNSSTVQPQTIKILYYIVIANSTKTEIQSDIDEIATDLNGKADVDLTNVSPGSTFKHTVMNWSMLDYSSVITIASGTSSYTAPSDGLISFNLDAGTNHCSVNGHTVYIAGNDSGNEGPVQLLLSSGDVISIPTTNNTFCFIPLKGAN